MAQSILVSSRPVLYQNLKQDMIIRWVIGENRDNPIRSISFEIMEVSIRYAKLVFPNARKMISMTYLPLSMERVYEIAQRHQIELEILDPLPRDIDQLDYYHSFWRYLFNKRTDRYVFDLILDHTCVLWKLCKVINAWLYYGGLMMSGSYDTSVDSIVYGYTDKLGKYQDKIQGLGNKIWINPSMVGLGAGVDDLSLPAERSDRITDFYDNNGWLAYNFILHNGLKHLVPIKAVAIVNDNQDIPNLVDQYYGAYFSRHNVGIYSTYQRQHKMPLLKQLHQLEELVNFDKAPNKRSMK